MPLSKAKTIVIDEDKGWIFKDEDHLFKHFKTPIEFLEEEFFKLRKGGDFSDEELEDFEHQLNPTLEEPDEVWVDKDTLGDNDLHIYIKEFPNDDESDSIFHVALTYITNKVPSFVYLHFPTKHLSLVESYQRGEIIFDRIMEEAPIGAIEGDALVESDEMALGLYQAMLKLRLDSDIPEEEFRDYAHLREPTIEEADEIWRHNDSYGNVIVNFVKEFQEESVYYIAITIEDAPSNSHALLFTFPTRDINLVSRYRQGENLEADEVVQESSH